MKYELGKILYFDPRRTGYSTKEINDRCSFDEREEDPEKSVDREKSTKDEIKAVIDKNEFLKRIEKEIEDDVDFFRERFNQLFDLIETEDLENRKLLLEKIFSKLAGEKGEENTDTNDYYLQLSNLNDQSLTTLGKQLLFEMKFEDAKEVFNFLQNKICERSHVGETALQREIKLLESTFYSSTSEYFAFLTNESGGEISKAMEQRMLLNYFKKAFLNLRNILLRLSEDEARTEKKVDVLNMSKIVKFTIDFASSEEINLISPCRREQFLEDTKNEIYALDFMSAFDYFQNYIKKVLNSNTLLGIETTLELTTALLERMGVILKFE